MELEKMSCMREDAARRLAAAAVEPQIDQPVEDGSIW
jgi:hypothetical protein